jgi:hypothetical protein
MSHKTWVPAGVSGSAAAGLVVGEEDGETPLPPEQATKTDPASTHEITTTADRRNPTPPA